MKRVVEGVSTTVVEEQLDFGAQPQQRPLLKLKRPKQILSCTRRVLNELDSISSTQDILRPLLELERSLPLDNLEENEAAMHSLWERLHDCKDVVVKAKIISLIGDLARFPGANALSVVDEMMRLLSTEESHKVKAHIIHSLMSLGKLYSHESKLIQTLVSTAVEHLKDSHHAVRRECLQLIGHLGSTDSHMTGSNEQNSVGIQGLVMGFTSDSDPRVRTSALEALLTLHERGQALDVALYDEASKTLDDDYEDVRMVAIKLIWVFSHICPERIVQLPTSDEARLVDDAFIKICNMVNDLSMRVRAEAVGLLGSLHHVSPRFLEQTLDKKVMSHLKRRKTDHEKKKERFAAGESSVGSWATGRNWGEGSKQEELAPDEVSLMSSGACGAFVHGLEDEYLEVRMPALDSLCELANQNRSFATLCLDFLVDMFNDEIESVRLNAINSLRKVCHHIQLREDQLEVVLGVLEDFSWEIREEVRELLSHCQLSTRPCLHAAIHALLGNLAKYPQDRASIWRCAKHMGKNHKHLASSLVPELLSTHPFFATPEPSVDDPAYVAIVILVFNATVDSPTMIPMFPKHTRRHYSYLRDSHPDLVPHLPIEVQSLETRGASALHGPGSSGVSFIEGILQRIQSVASMDPVNAQRFLTSTIRDLNHTKGIDKQYVANSRCMALYLECQLAVLQAQGDKIWNIPGPLCATQGTGLKSLVQKLLMTSYHIEHAFHGLSASQVLLLHELRIIAHSLQILATQRCDTRTEKSLGSTLSVWQSFLARIRHYSALVGTSGTKIDEFSQALLSFQQFFEANITKPSCIADYLQSFILKRRVKCLELSSHLKEVSAILTEPQGGSENPVCFSAELTFGINVDALLENIANPSCVRVQVVFPDMRRQLFTPRHEDFHRLSNLRHRLVTKVVLSHSRWTEAGFIEVSLVIKYQADVDEENVVNLGVITADTESRTLRQVKNSTDNLEEGVVGLCAPVRICIVTGVFSPDTIKILVRLAETPSL